MSSIYLYLSICLSFFFFLFTYFFSRQYYSSCKTGNMDSALSIWFLLLWLAGDSCNLTGSFLADQLPLQVRDGYVRTSISSLKVNRLWLNMLRSECFAFGGFFLGGREEPWGKVSLVNIVRHEPVGRLFLFVRFMICLLTFLKFCPSSSLFYRNTLRCTTSWRTF